MHGYDKLQAEFQYLHNQVKPRVAEQKRIAAEHGDRSENAEYHAAKEQLRHIDKRLRYLNALIEDANVIDPASYIHDCVRFGSTVALNALEDDSLLTVTICGAYEADSEQGLITTKAPLARSLLGKKVDDEVVFHVGDKQLAYRIESIAYEPFEQLLPYTKAMFERFK